VYPSKYKKREIASEAKVITTNQACTSIDVAKLVTIMADKEIERGADNKVSHRNDAFLSLSIEVLVCPFIRSSPDI
jgi:hypothetical protein